MTIGQSMLAKDKSMSRHPDFAEYKRKTGLLFPKLWRNALLEQTRQLQTRPCARSQACRARAKVSSNWGPPHPLRSTSFQLFFPKFALRWVRRAIALISQEMQTLLHGSGFTHNDSALGSRGQYCPPCAHVKI